MSDDVLGDVREPDDDEIVTETIVLDDGRTVMGVDPLRPIDARHVDDDDRGPFEPIGVERSEVMRVNGVDDADISDN